ncbi:MAG TPA: PEP-CTERM sorting domain-containing protein [Rhizomicrobium sp.]|jgi:hypothetical protein|nr:PEP-CTERM sorting domain-containing protein [Rhizomicrobium sp.]
MKLSAVLFGAAITIAGSIAMAGAANAAAFTVEALSDSIASPLDTGLILNPALTYDFAVANPANIWSAGSNSPYSRDSTANGIDPVASHYGQWTQNGFTANFGALVGFTTADGYFLIGTGPIDLSGLTGDLQLMYWDNNYPDNSGQQVLDVSSVPEPVTLSLFGAGLVGAAAMRRRRKVGKAA